MNHTAQAIETLMNLLSSGILSPEQADDVKVKIMTLVKSL